MEKCKWLVLVLLGLTPLLWGDFTRTTSLIDVPTAPELKPGEFVFVTNGSFNVRGGFENATDIDLAVRFGLGNRFEGVISAFNLNAFALSGSYLLLEESEKRPAVAFGIDNITYNQYVSPIGIGEDKTYSDHKYRYRNPEIASAYISATKNLYFLRFALGLGRGRFVGYGPRSHYFNTDGLFGDTYETGEGSAGAIGLFFGLAVLPYPGVELIGEMDGRDGNLGARYRFKNGSVNLAYSHIEGTFSDAGGPAGTFSSRLSAGFEISSRMWTERVRHGIIAGTILDQASQQLLSNTLIEIAEIGKRYRINAGKFKLTLKPGAYSFKVMKKDYVDQARRVIVKSGKTVETTFYMVMSPEAIAKGKKAKEVEVILRQAVFFYNNDSLLQARAKFAEVLKADPQNKDALSYLGATNRKIAEKIGIYRTNALVATDRKDYQTAIDNWEMVLTLDPNNERAKAEIAVLKKRLAAKPTVTKKPVKKATKEEIEALYQKGVRLFAQKRYKEALKVFNTVLKLSPSHTGAKKYKVRTQARIKALGG